MYTMTVELCSNWKSLRIQFEKIYIPSQNFTHFPQFRKIPEEGQQLLSPPPPLRIFLLFHDFLLTEPQKASRSVPLAEECY
jgi:hypothetical protein